MFGFLPFGHSPARAELLAHLRIGPGRFID